MKIILDWSNDIQKCNISVNDKIYNILDIDHGMFNLIKNAMSDAERLAIIDAYPDTSKCFTKNYGKLQDAEGNYINLKDFFRSKKISGNNPAPKKIKSIKDV